MNANAVVKKLQTALCIRGTHVRVNHYQHYSEKKGRMVTKFVATMKKEVEGKKKSVVICESYRMIDIAKALASLLDGGGET